ncbi:MAG TPA: methyltransferase domain-containing protein [Candidatus Limnocylindria bacterium]
MTRPARISTDAFSATASDYAATMAIALASVAAEVVARARLGPGETVLDVGTGTGTAARLAAGDGRRILGLDAAAGMLEVAREASPGIEFIEADFASIPLADEAVDVVTSVHALLFAGDRVAALEEWRRVTAVGGRLSLSVPGPNHVVPAAIFGAIYDRHEIEWYPDDYPEGSDLLAWSGAAGWADARVDADESTLIELADEEAFHAWLRVGRSTTDWPPARFEAFGHELMAACPRGDDGSFRIPFGTIYLTARRDT